MESKAESVVGLVMEEIARHPIHPDVTYVSILAHESGSVTIAAVVGWSWRGAFGVGNASSRNSSSYRDVFDKAVSEAVSARAVKMTAAEIAAAEFGGLTPAIR